MLDEFEKIAWLQKRLQLSDDRVLIGIGDDAAEVRLRSDRAIVTVDTQVQGVYVHPAWISWRAIGWRAVIAATSDVWAMGTAPTASVVSLTLPGNFPDSDFFKLVQGVAEAAEQTDAPVVGGNLSAGPVVSVTTTVFGSSRDMVLQRSDAKAGDGVFVTGTLGGAALGLLLLQRVEKAPTTAHDDVFVARWKCPPVHLSLIHI